MSRLLHATSASPLRCVFGAVGPAQQLLASTSAATTILMSMALLALASSAVVSADAASQAVFPAPFTRTLTLGWTPDEPMPNSAGCVHTHPSALQQLGELLKSRCGVVARPNTDGRLPYPYSPQGLAVVYELAS